MDSPSPSPTLPDRWGYAVGTASASCLAAIDAYYNQILTHGRRRSVILDALAHDPACALANALAAHFLASRHPHQSAALLAAAAEAAPSATAYDRAAVAALAALLGGDQEEAFDRHVQLLKEYPRDLVSLKRAQLLCFYMGRPDLSLELVEQVIPHNRDESYIYGMLAFPLLELGSMAEAETAARKGFQINKLDLWSHHNLCHVLQYQCRLKEAVDFMEACSSLWSSCSSFMYTHNWWHVAVCYLEGHSPLQKVLDVYDQYIWKEMLKDDVEYGEVYINALGLLFKLYVRGEMESIKDRLAVLVQMFKDESTWNMDWLLDLQGLWALSSSGEINKAKDLLQCMKSRFDSMSSEKQHMMQSAIPLAEAIYEYGRRNCQKVFDILGPDFDAMDYKMIGASDEQLDVFNELWYDVLLSTRHTSKAIEVLRKQIKIREGVPFLWRSLEKAYSMEGRSDDAFFAGEKAKALEGAYF